MSFATIDYGKLKDAYINAIDVSDKLKDYKDELVKLATKMPSKKTANIRIADLYLRKKIGELEEDIKKFEAFYRNIATFKSECKIIDICVHSLVNSLTASFKKAHMIFNDEDINRFEF